MLAGSSMRLLRGISVGILLLATSRPARAEGFFTPFVGFSFGGDAATCISLTSCEEKRVNWGVSFGARRGAVGFEEDIGYAPSFFGKTPVNDNAVLTIMSNLMLVAPAGPIQPYALIGVGLVRPHATFTVGSLALDKNALGYDLGGGLNIYFARNVGVRGDLRHISTFKTITLGVFGKDQLNFWRASAGLAFRF